MRADMAGMKNMEAMLKSMLEAQESLAKQVGELAQKVTSMEQQTAQVPQLVQKIDGMDYNVKALTDRVRFMDWKSLRWRRVEWERIPPDMREMVVTFLSAADNMSLNSAISHKKLRKQLKKSYKDAVIPGFDKHRFTDKGDFKGLRWVMKAGVALQRCEVAPLEAVLPRSPPLVPPPQQRLADPDSPWGQLDAVPVRDLAVCKFRTYESIPRDLRARVSKALGHGRLHARPSRGGCAEGR